MQHEDYVWFRDNNDTIINDYLKKIEDNELNLKEVFHLIDYLKFSIGNTEHYTFNEIIEFLSDNINGMILSKFILEPSPTKEIVISLILNLKDLNNEIESRCDFDNTLEEFFENNGYKYDDSEFKEIKNITNVYKNIYRTIQSIIRKLSTYTSLSIYNDTLEDIKKENRTQTRIEVDKTDDKRLSIYRPPNKNRIKALTEFAPELIKQLLNLDSESQKSIIHLITGVNKEDSYKYTFGIRKSELKTVDIPELDELKKTLFDKNK